MDDFAKHQIMTFFAPGDKYFDIGAHKGDKAIPFINNNVECILIEPQPFCVDHLKKTFLNNPLVQILAIGLGESRNVLEMSINTNEPVLSTFNEEWKTGRFANSLWDSKIEVPIMTIDNLIEKYGHPRYIKIDVEGFEFQVLKGLTKKTGLISFEFTSEFYKNASKCITYLNSFGYNKFNFSQGDNTNFFLENWMDASSFNLMMADLCLKNNGLWGDIYAN